MQPEDTTKTRRGFYMMADVLPQGERGRVRIEHQAIDSQPVFRGSYTRPGIYAGLVIDGHLWMSDTDDEREWNADALRAAKGDVLIAGLGLGMVALPMLQRDQVRSVTVIERDQNVNHLVTPHLERFAGPGPAAKLRVVIGDIHTWRPAVKGRQFDTIYFDIWPTICLDDLADMKELHAAFRPYLRRGGWIGSWQYDHLRELKREGRWR